MCNYDKIRKHSGSPYVEPKFTELYLFDEK